MPKISEMSAPPGAITGLELVPLLQGANNAGLPLLATRAVPSGAVLQLRRAFVADMASTADADPGTGKLRWNNATPASATILYVDDQDVGAVDISATWATLAVGGFVYVQGRANSAARANWQKWQITSVADVAGYAKLGVSLQASAGTFADTTSSSSPCSSRRPRPA